MSDFVQFDAAETVVGGINIAEAIASSKKLVFNESYTITGGTLSAPSVYACYDLTVIGNMQVDDIEIRGNLYVLGSVKAKRLSCLKAIICSGDIDAEEINANEIVANNITCHSISCSGNILARTTIDISGSLNTEKSVMAGEGILGNGRFSAKAATAGEYFDFDGEAIGKIFELETDTTFGEPQSTPAVEETFEVLSQKIQKRIKSELLRAGEIDEDKLVEFVAQLSEIDEDMLYDWKELTDKLVELSYLDKITNLKDYLIIIMATKLLPEEIVGYETLEHVFDELLIEAEKNIDALSFHAKTVEEFAYALKIVSICEKELRIDKNEAIDRIFQSVGIKYKTVKTYLG